MSYRLLIHGGAGAMRSMSATAESAYRSGLAASILDGKKVLAKNGSAREAVVASVRQMELSMAFNAGRGSALALDGTIESDAAVMDGEGLETGAVAAVPGVTNAVALADALLDGSVHCLLAGEGAVRWAESIQVGVEKHPVPEARLRSWQARVSAPAAEHEGKRLMSMSGTHDLGDTVGAVALDSNGRIAVAVSTGGIWLKENGRVGDSPLVGAGYWADSQSGAACATGTGEFIMRSILVSRIVLQLEAGYSAIQSARSGLDWLSSRFGAGKAGVIAIDRNGGMTAPFDTAGMGRAWVTETMSAPTVGIWPEDPML